MTDIIYPFKKYNYKVIMDGREEAGFSEVSAPDFNATSNEVAIESLELVCEGITRTM